MRPELFSAKTTFGAELCRRFPVLLTLQVTKDLGLICLGMFKCHVFLFSSRTNSCFLMASLLKSVHTGKYAPGLASCEVVWISERFNCNRLKCSVHHATFHETFSLLVFSSFYCAVQTLSTMCTVENVTITVIVIKGPAIYSITHSGK